MTDLSKQVVQLARLALRGPREDVELYVRRIARKLKDADPEVADQLDKLVSGPTRRTPARSMMLPVDTDSRLELLREDAPENTPRPIWSESTESAIGQLVAERQKKNELADAGLHPSRSALFVGPPGVGKTMSARWLADQLGMKLLTLDLSAVMSSFLGRTGSNLRNVMDYARGHECVLLLDEFDAIAKRRDDASEVGELKRLVTVLLQEVDEWPASGLLVAASNHPELLDPAVWRRFDSVVRFESPTVEQCREAVRRLLSGFDVPVPLANAVGFAFQQLSFSEIEREVRQAQRISLVERVSMEDALEGAVRRCVIDLPKQSQIELAVALVDECGMSSYAAQRMTTVSRPTISKHSKKGAA